MFGMTRTNFSEENFYSEKEVQMSTYGGSKCIKDWGAGRFTRRAKITRWPCFVIINKLVKQIQLTVSHL